MIVIKAVEILQKYLFGVTEKELIGFVPTMGALHEGHLSLIRQAKAENDYVVVSIFVNPTQFDKLIDLEKYPRNIDADLKKLKKVGCNVVFTPGVDEMYPKNVQSLEMDYDGLDKYMEGAFRNGHFAGVGTVVKRLFEIVKPDKAYFGEKDYQQLLIIKKMVEKQDLPVTIISCPIYREKDGLAFSSRNVRLTEKQRKAAPLIYRTLKTVKEHFSDWDIEEIKAYVENEFNKCKELELEYFEISDADTLQPVIRKEKGKQYRGFIAAYAGSVRLIDNIAIN